MDEKLNFLIASFDLYLRRNYEPGTAWQQALRDYAAKFRQDGAKKRPAQPEPLEDTDG